MNLILVLLSVIGYCLLSSSALKAYEGAQAMAPAARIVLLLIAFLGLYAAAEALACRTPARPGAALLAFLVGTYSIFRTFGPLGASLLVRPSFWHRVPDSPPKV